MTMFNQTQQSMKYIKTYIGNNSDIKVRFHTFWMSLYMRGAQYVSPTDLRVAVCNVARI